MNLGGLTSTRTNHHYLAEDVRLSKALAWILRHGALQEGFRFEKGGFLNVIDILRHASFSGFTVDDVKRVVTLDQKERYALRETLPPNSRLQIRANQGHSIEVSDLDLTEITNASSVTCVVHGTYTRNWDIIRIQGLSRMGRNHVHFASSEPGSEEVVSGVRSNCDVFIYIDLERALRDGMKFFRSSNGVVLCAGDERGVVPCDYFSRVVHKNIERNKTTSR